MRKYFLTAPTLFETDCASTVMENIGTANDFAPSRQLGLTMVPDFCKSDVWDFVSKLPENVRLDFGAEGFNPSWGTLCKSLGNPVKGEFVTQLDNPMLDIQIWKVKFVRESATNRSNRKHCSRSSPARTTANRGSSVSVVCNPAARMDFS